jgi:hypothetical protein
MFDRGYILTDCYKLNEQIQNGLPIKEAVKIECTNCKPECEHDYCGSRDNDYQS